MSPTGILVALLWHFVGPTPDPSRLHATTQRFEDFEAKTLICRWKPLPVRPAGGGAFGGERGIRTLDGGNLHTPLAGERLQPLGHLSKNFYIVNLVRPERFELPTP